MKIWVDADACPVVIKEILFRAAERTQMQLTLVANQALQIPRSAGPFDLVTPSSIAAAADRGVQVHVWTINDPVQMSVMISRGADGLITDEPALARQVLELREDLSPLARLVIWMAGETGLLQGLEEASPEGDA